MPLTSIHFNGGVNLADAETVMREIARRVPAGVRRVPDGETGDRQQWVFFQQQKFSETPGLEQAAPADLSEEGYKEMPLVRIAEGTSPDEIAWPDLGYATAYQESFQTFRRLQVDGVVPSDVRFQVEYPTPLASIGTWIVPEDQDRLEGPYERALFADLDRLLAALPHDEIAVQWDVAVEFGILEGRWSTTQELDAVVQRLARCADRVPHDVPVGMHLCYGDYMHRHFKEPESLELQVNVVNRVAAEAGRPVDWFAFTVPQYQRDPTYFAPLRELRVPPTTQLNFALVPYHPAEQEAGTTDEQVRLVEEYLTAGRGEILDWGICTECGMARAERDEIPALLDLHREILARHGTP
ncbi:MAG: hypothetical protein ACRDMV_20505 [Streptosporangiales bacterium]